MKIYQIDSSARKKGSTSRALAKKLLDKIKKPGDEVLYRDLDEEMLKHLAELTGGQYFRAKSSEELTAIYQVINELEPVEQETRSYRPTKALFYWFLCFSMLAYGILVMHNACSKLYRNIRHSKNISKTEQTYERGNR